MRVALQHEDSEDEQTHYDEQEGHTITHIEKTSKGKLYRHKG